jgi:hypothetical protein
MDDVEQPVVLVQDYHFALVPRLIKEKRPDARVSIFWHILGPILKPSVSAPGNSNCSTGCWAPI